jgi:hypothetical protein
MFLHVLMYTLCGATFSTYKVVYFITFVYFNHTFNYILKYYELCFYFLFVHCQYIEIQLLFVYNPYIYISLVFYNEFFYV